MSDPAATVMHGVEIDPVSAAIGNHLIPTGSRIDIGNLTGVTLPHHGAGVDGYDLVVGNVPFASYVPHAADNPDRLSLHNYALVKAARMTRPGGYLAVLTSRYTLDATTSTTRDQLAALTNLVAAVRLPTDAHAERAGTAVVTDILICHRPAEFGELSGWPRPVPVDVDGITVNVNEHFTAHPDRVLGELAVGGIRHEDDRRVLHPTARSGGYLDALTATLTRIAPAAPRLDPDGMAPAAADRRMAVDSPLPLGSIVTSGARYQRLTSTGAVEHKVPATQRAELNALCQLRDLVRAVLDADATGHPDADQHRGDLNRAYGRYVTRWGPLNRFDTRPPTRDSVADDDSDGPVGGKRIYPRMGGFRNDPGWWSVTALEHFDDDTQTATKAPLLSGPVARTATYPDHVDDPATAVRVLLARDGDITPDAAAALAGIDIADTEDWLGDEVFRDPAHEGALAPAAIYLTGLVRDKLSQARTAAERDERYRRNIDALEAVQPAWLTAHDITPRIGATWIPADDLRQFLVDELGLPHATVVHVPELASWTLSAGGYSADNEYTYAVNPRRTAVELVEDLANQRAT
ncbi:MAG: hypothetical protein H0U21_17430, partial [Acidimicrobiia bacterium]|nr:hypothetical protein [Acidimicrobiia bacterium]